MKMSGILLFQAPSDYIFPNPVRKVAPVKDVRASNADAVRDYTLLASPIVPNRWRGECGCVVGPFSSNTVAEYFAHSVVDFGQYETVSHRVFVKGDSWYVEVSELIAPSVLSPSKS